MPINAPKKVISTGFSALDEVTGGLLPRTLSVLGSRPAVGKTSLLNSIVSNVVGRKSTPVVYFSMEHSASILVERLERQMGAVDAHSMRRETGVEMHEEASWERLGTQADASIFIDESPSHDIDRLCSAIRAFALTRSSF